MRYVGVTTSEGPAASTRSRQIMRRHPLDFIQVSYSAVERDVEARILPLARDRGIAVVINRPFREGALIRAMKRRPLPAWASEADCANWAEFLLKFIVSHPAVVCAIPATTSVDHVRENMGACYGRLPDEPMRRRMAAHVEQFRLRCPSGGRTRYRISCSFRRAPTTDSSGSTTPTSGRRRSSTLALGVAVVGLLRHPRAGQGRIVAAILAGCWLWVAWAFHWRHYATINWAGDLFRRSLRARGASSHRIGVVRNDLAFGSTSSASHRDRLRPSSSSRLPCSRSSVPSSGEDGCKSETFGAAPDPTAVATLGFLLAARRTRGVDGCGSIPILWCALSGAVLWTMDSPDAFVVPAAALRR